MGRRLRERKRVRTAGDRDVQLIERQRPEELSHRAANLEDRIHLWIRRIHASGSTISARVGSVLGEVHTALNPAIPTRSTTSRVNAAPCAYCRIFASTPSNVRSSRPTNPPPLRCSVNRARIVPTVGTTLGPTASIT